MPKTIRVAPAPRSIVKTKQLGPRQKAIDVWDTVTGAGWDLTIPKSAASYIHYLGTRMAESTEITDVIPLVYTRHGK